MPFYYDMNRPITTSGTSGTELQHAWGKTVANQETVSLTGVYCAAQFATAGGAQFRVKDNTGTTASGASSTTWNPKNRRGNPAAQSIFNTTSASSASTFVAGTTLVTRLTIGFAQTGGMGGYVPIVPSAAIQMMPNATNPVDLEFTSVATTASVPFDLTLEIAEGI